MQILKKINVLKKYMDKIKGLVDEEMYKRIYDKTNKEITRINMELEELNKKKKLMKINH